MSLITKSCGSKTEISKGKVVSYLLSLSKGLAGVDVEKVASSVLAGLGKEGVTTKQVDDLCSWTSASLCSVHPDYSLLAARVCVRRMHKETLPSMKAVYPYLSDEVASFCVENEKRISDAIDFEMDYSYDYFGLKTLEKSYLIRDKNGKVVERPQVMLMRVAAGIHAGNIYDCIRTYDMMARKVFIHATPTMFNSGTRNPTLASCFLLPVEEDSIDGIFRTNHKCALISKSAGGIGFSVSNVRASGAKVGETGGRSAGILPMLRCFEATARYVDQGGGKRRGAFAAYLEPWHPDVRVFLEMKKNHGAEELRARDLFYALWIPDIFMKRVEEGGKWSLFCPSDCPHLVDLHGEEFEREYLACEEKEGLEGGDRGAVALVCNPRLPDGDWHSIHAVQGRLQRKVEPVQPRDYSVLQSLYRDSRVLKQ